MSYMCKRHWNKECDGCGDCDEYKPYYCPICGEEVLEAVYVSNDGEVIGCENCAQIKEPHEMFDDEA